MSASARSLMCACTPPGTSHEYGHAMPIRTGAPPGVSCARPIHCAGPIRGAGTVHWARTVHWADPVHVTRATVTRDGAVTAAGQSLGIKVVDEHLLQHVPVLRVLNDRLLEDPREGLSHGGRLLLAA